MLLPPAVAFVVAALTASAGLSGAFLLLPFQMSVLGFVTPAVSPTNLVYNIIALPGGIYRYAREGRMLWPLALATIAGTLPGVWLGAAIRIHVLADPRHAKVFVGAVLLYLAWRLLRGQMGTARGLPPGAAMCTRVASLRLVEYEFMGKVFAFRPLPVVALSLAVGLVGGIYGVGGGAIIAPFAVAVLGLPVYTVAGAAMCGTLVTSLAGVAFFALMGTPADWLLGALFGAGGLAGSYVGARVQRYLPERWIRLGLGLLVAGMGAAYLAGLAFKS